ncbi:hypothetical protein [Caldalkalibacillus mannanilyticus]|uniref:hypothetical protein n=1 Tax=Caldalkalibacillus mannanilyticus TaxID=1418 RepID=UPI000A766ABA|nr:hypothetical protein [Caldalkalibacillus mannanilyticus]
MSNNIDKSILLVGAGRMAIEYARVLQALSCPFQVVGRSLQSAQTFLEKTGVPAYTGGIEKWTEESRDTPRMAIVASGQNS